MKTKYKYFDAIFSYFGYYSMFLMWFLILTAINLGAFIFGDYDFVDGFAGILGILLPAITPIMIVSGFSLIYKLLQTSPISVLRINDMYFMVFELMVIPAFVYSALILAAFGDAITLAFLVQKLFLILNVGYVSLFLMSSVEMKLLQRKILLPFFLSYAVSFGYLISYEIWENHLREDSSGLYLNFALTGILLISAVILKTVLKKKTLKRIYG
ncbi:MAG: hypothetical protein WC900_07020 [Oscillospiraceae bacterium]